MSVATLKSVVAKTKPSETTMSFSGEMTEDEMLLLALEESAKLHQSSINSEVCTSTFEGRSKSGMELLQLPIVNQFHPKWNPLISKFKAPSAICGYTAIACARFIAALEAPVTKAELQGMLSNVAAISGYVEHSMLFIHDCRVGYISKHPAHFTEKSASTYIKSWVANYEISDYFRRVCPASERPHVAFVRFNQYSEVSAATHEEFDRISSHEAGFDDAQILVETFFDTDILGKRPHFHRPSELQQLPPIRSAVVDVNGHFACAAMCSDGGALFNTMDSSSVSFPGSETTAVALTILASDRSAREQEALL
jgi:hypothetical protein